MLTFLVGATRTTYEVALRQRLSLAAPLTLRLDLSHGREFDGSSSEVLFGCLVYF